jgi:uncharacterized linocin/CFP29 family protein
VNLLKRELAPITPEAWEAIDEEASRVLRLHLAARKVVDFHGPTGWETAAIPTGRLAPLEAPRPDVSARLREAQPLVELRAPFRVPIDELDDISRGALDPDFRPLIEAAARIAAAEDAAVFDGWPAGRIVGMLRSTPHAPVRFGGAPDLPSAVVRAKEVLRHAGVDGPLALLLGPATYDSVFGDADEGFPILDRVAPLAERIVWAPTLAEAALVSTRGGDFELAVGHDLAIGYSDHDAESVGLYLTESVTFRVLEGAAAVEIRGEAQ